MDFHSDCFVIVGVYISKSLHVERSGNGKFLLFLNPFYGTSIEVEGAVGRGSRGLWGRGGLRTNPYGGISAEIWLDLI